jgi:hypothetical protein
MADVVAGPCSNAKCVAAGLYHLDMVAKIESRMTQVFSSSGISGRLLPDHAFCIQVLANRSFASLGKRSFPCGRRWGNWTINCPASEHPVTRPGLGQRLHLVTDIVTALLQSDGFLCETSENRVSSEKPNRKVTLFGMARFDGRRIDSVMVSVYFSPDLILITLTAGC